MQPKAQTSKEYFTFLTTIHAALLGTQVLFAMVVYYVNTTNSVSDLDAESLNDIFKFVVPVFIVVSYMGGSFFVNTQLKALRAKPELKEKLGGYRATLLIKFAQLEVPALFSIVCFLLTSNYLYLGFAGVIMVLFLLNRPTRNSTANDLELTPSERTLLENRAAAVA